MGNLAGLLKSSTELAKAEKTRRLAKRIRKKSSRNFAPSRALLLRQINPSTKQPAAPCHYFFFFPKFLTDPARRLRFACRSFALQHIADAAPALRVAVI